MNIRSSLKESICMGGVGEHSSLKPQKLAVVITLIYMVSLAFYIILSGKIARLLSVSIINLADIELAKGMLYTLITGIAFFYAVNYILKKIEEKNNLIIKQNKSIISTEPFIITGIYSASVCHDINNFMLIIINNIELLKKIDNIDKYKIELLNNVLTTSNIITDMVKMMMQSCKHSAHVECPYLNLSDIIIETINFAKIHNKIKGCKMTLDIQSSINTNVNRFIIERMLMNLLLNSAEATNLTGAINVKLYRDHEGIKLEVHDNGPGVQEELQDKIFEPFYTSKEGGNGLGLLSLKICAEQHHGVIQLRQSELGGACFCVVFPAESHLQDQEQSLPDLAVSVGKPSNCHTS